MCSVYANMFGMDNRQESDNDDDKLPDMPLDSPVVHSESGTLQAILTELSSKINRQDVLRINVTRSSVLDGALRAFRRTTYSPLKQMLIRFADDDGVTEGAVDQGGPLREFFRLLIMELFSSKLFVGPLNHKVLTHDVRGNVQFLNKMDTSILLRCVRPSFTELY